MASKRLLALIPCFAMFLCSCVNSDIQKTLSRLLNQKMTIPYEQLEKRSCSYFRDSINEEQMFTFIIYIDGDQCAPCELSDLSFMEKHYRCDTLWQKLRKVYICDVSPVNANALYSHLCNLRIESDVYFDTCHIFRERNPIVPDSKMFHTFVLDRDGNIKLVGNPFKNVKLKGLLQEIIENYEQFSIEAINFFPPSFLHFCKPIFLNLSAQHNNPKTSTLLYTWKHTNTT